MTEHEATVGLHVRLNYPTDVRYIPKIAALYRRKTGGRARACLRCVGGDPLLVDIADLHEVRVLVVG